MYIYTYVVSIQLLSGTKMCANLSMPKLGTPLCRDRTALNAKVPLYRHHMPMLEHVPATWN